VTSVSSRLHQAATRVLVHEAGGVHTTSLLAAAAGRLLDGLFQQPAQLIGQAGVQALLVHAVRLRRREFPFLDESMFFPQNGESPGEALCARLQEQDPEMIMKASVTLFATTADVLATLIGERLVWDFVQDAWPETLVSEAELQAAEE
jgi:hypothetical protein